MLLNKGVKNYVRVTVKPFSDVANTLHYVITKMSFFEHRRF